MRVALIHDYLREYGGAERVLEVLHEIFPDAPVYVAYYNPKGLGSHAGKFANWDIRTSWFQKFPFANQLLSPFRIFGPMMFESFDMSGYDLVISSSSATHLAKSVITKPETLHISYIHTPPRFLYGYVTSFNYKKRWWIRVGGEIINHFMRMYDFEVSQRPDILVANSKNIAERIRKFYRRESVVIYPPISMSFPRKRESILKQKNGFRISKASHLLTQKVKSGMTNEGYFLSLGRLVRGKGTEVIVEACAKLGLPLKVVGTGPELESLKRITYHVSRIMNNIEFLGEVKDEDLPELYANAKALIVASEDEDFGITPVEAQLMGTPVIAPASGGFLETVEGGLPAGRQGKTGMFYGGPGAVSVESLIDALNKFKSEDYKPEDCMKNAQKFSKEKFKKEILELVDKNISK